MQSVTKVVNSQVTFLILLTAALFSMSLALYSKQAKASNCPEIPAVSWWGDTSVEKMTAFVDRKYKGDWAPYIRKWEAYEDRMRDVMFRGNSAVIKSHGIVLKNEDLVNYVRQIAQRVVATRCIADQVIDVRLIEEISNMDTAAGSNPELEIQLVE